VRIRPDVGVVSVYVTVTAKTWEPSSFKSKFTIFCKLFDASKSSLASFSFSSDDDDDDDDEGGERGRDVGVADEGIFISASMRTLEIVFLGGAAGQDLVVCA